MVRDAEIEVLVDLVKNGESDAYHLHKRTGLILQTVQAARNRLEKKNLIVQTREEPSAKNKKQPKKIFGPTLQGVAVAVSKLSDERKKHEREEMRNGNQDGVESYYREFQTDLARLIIQNKDLHWILKEVSEIVGKSGFSSTCSGWLYVTDVLLVALQSAMPDADNFDAYVSCISRATTDQDNRNDVDLIFEFEFFKTFVTAWKPGKENFYCNQTILNAMFASALSTISASEEMLSAAMIFLDDERDESEKRLSLMNEILAMV